MEHKINPKNKNLKRAELICFVNGLDIKIRTQNYIKLYTLKWKK